MRAIDADALIEFCAERWIPLNIDAVNMQPTVQPVATDTNVGNNSEIPNSSDAINRQDAIDALDCISGTEEVLRSLPPAQPEPKEGHWKKDETDDCPPVFRQFRICSVCGAIETSETNYCPNCGAKMTNK